MKWDLRQRGFTLPELMVAGLVSTIVVFPAMALFFKTLEIQAEAQTRLRANAQARQILKVLADGSWIGGSGGNDGSGVIYGLRGRNAPYLPPLRQEYRFVLAGNGLEASGDTFGQITIGCTAVAAPLPDCPGADVLRTMAGWVGADIGVSVSPRSVAGRTVEVILPITSPSAAERAPAGQTVVENYRTVFTMRRETPDV